MILSVLVVPNAHQSEIVGWQEGVLKIRLAAPPIEGRANEELIGFLAEFFDLAPSTIDLLKGSASRMKRVQLPLSIGEVKDAVARAGY